jgi:hypothetical protein
MAMNRAYECLGLKAPPRKKKGEDSPDLFQAPADE